MIWTVRLLWPHSSLSPNARVHWGEKSRAAKLARRNAYFCACHGGFRLVEVAGPLDVTLTFHAPDARRRDMDNLLAAMKPALDGVAEAGGVDDARFRLRLERGEARPPAGIVLVRIEPAEGGAATPGPGHEQANL